MAVVIVAAGRGDRAGSAGGPKQYRWIGGKPILLRTLEVFARHRAIGSIVAVIHPDDQLLFTEAVGPVKERVTAIIGGATRQDSVRLGLEALQGASPHTVLIHDAARPFADAALIDRTIAAVEDNQAALPAIEISDTLKRSDVRWPRLGDRASRPTFRRSDTTRVPFSANSRCTSEGSPGRPMRLH